MVKGLLLLMVKHMSNKYGFTLIEQLFVFFIIVMLSGLSMSIHKPRLNDEHVIEDLTHCLNQAQLNAMIYKETTWLTFEEDGISIESDHFNKEYHLPRGRSLTKHRLSFNGFGHIYKPKTIYYNGSQKRYAFVFQVGSGHFYVK